MSHTSPACHVMPSCIVSSVALIRDAGRFTMVAIAQSVEHLIVVQEVARSSRVSHPFCSYASKFPMSYYIELLRL